MIGYVTLGTNKFDEAAKFYDDLLSLIGATRFMEMPDAFIAWSSAPKSPGLSIIKPNDGNPATVGNGTMVALIMESREMVDKMHAKALELGGTCEGEPGPRGGDDSNFYAAYFRDLDGNKLNAFCMTGQPG